MWAVDSRLTVVNNGSNTNNNHNGASDDAFSEFSDDTMTVSSAASDYSPRPSSRSCVVGQQKQQSSSSSSSSSSSANQDGIVQQDQQDQRRHGRQRDEPEQEVELAAEEEENAAMMSARREFHSRRFVKVKNLPPDATEQDIRHLLKPLSVKDVQLNRVSETAKVTLLKPECLESFPTETRHGLNERCVVVAPSKTEGMLCVAHLPLAYTDHDFRSLVQMFGSIARCFLMRNERTGESKGYGFVEYSSKDVAYHAKSRLDGKSVGDTVLHCNWLDSSHVTYRSLHSKCIYVDHLPADYRNLIEFREVFSTIANPSYCQIAIRNGQPLGFGLVEFDSPHDAEEVQLAMQRYQLDDHKIRVTFCIPGYRAMVIYNKLTSVRVGSPPKQPLLPNPTLSYGKPSAAFGQLRNLTTQNPQIFQALQTLMKQNCLAGGSDFGLSDGKGCAATSPVHHQMPQQQSSSQSMCSNESNISAALILLLATQLQTEMGVQQTPILGNNNQLLSMVQNVLKKPDSISMQEAGQDLQSTLSLLANGQQTPTSMNYASPTSPCIKLERPNVSWNSNGSSSSCSATGDISPNYVVRKVPLLPNPPAALCSQTQTNNSTAGLLPRPNCSPLVNGLNSYHNQLQHQQQQQQQQQSTSALTYGDQAGQYQSSHQSNSPFLSQNQVPFSGQQQHVASAIQSPLLGQKPPGFAPQNCRQVSMTPTMPTCAPAGPFSDINFLQQLVVMAQLQQQQQQQQHQQQQQQQQQQHQQQQEQQTCSINMQGQTPPSNIAFGQQCPQASQAFLAHLQMQGGGAVGGGLGGRMGHAGGFVNLLQMATAGRTGQLRGSSLHGNSTVIKQEGTGGILAGPRMTSSSSSSSSTSSSSSSSSPSLSSSVLVGNGPFGPICGIPQAIPLSLASTAGAKLPFFPSGGATFGTLTDPNGKLSVQNGFLGPSLTSTNFCMPNLRQQPPHPILVSQLVAAGVQQRGSVLGDFWQFSQGAIFNNAQVLGVKRKLQFTLPDHNSINGVNMQNAFLPAPYFKRRRP